MLSRYDWQPGNGTRYDLFYGTTNRNRTLVSWMFRGGAGGKTLLFDGYLHYTYIMEKMDIRIADAVGILMFLKEMGHEVGIPDSSAGYERPRGEPYIKVLE